MAAETQPLKRTIAQSAIVQRGSNQVSGHFSRRPSWATIAIGVFCLTLTSSCGRSKVPEIKNKLAVFPVKGSLQMDGQPLSRAELTFHPVEGDFPEGAAKNLPRASTDGDGNFTISTYADNDGAPAGSYKVTVKWRGSDVRTDDEPNLIPPKYTNPRITQLRAKVEEGENTLPTFELKVSQQQASN
jgi:hypothetical protein